MHHMLPYHCFTSIALQASRYTAASTEKGAELSELCGVELVFFYPPPSEKFSEVISYFVFQHLQKEGV